jgi:hypothetical protein
MIKVTTTLASSAPTVREPTIGMIHEAPLPSRGSGSGGRVPHVMKDKTLVKGKTLGKGETWRIS